MGIEIRHLLFGVSSRHTHRVLYQIDGLTVNVLRVLSTSQDTTHGHSTATVVGGEGFFGILPTLNCSGIAQLLAVALYDAEAGYNYAPSGRVIYDVDFINYALGKGPEDVDMCVLTNIVTYYAVTDPNHTYGAVAEVGGPAGAVQWDGVSWDGGGGIFTPTPGAGPSEQIDGLVIVDSYGGTTFFVAMAPFSPQGVLCPDVEPFFSADVGDLVIAGGDGATIVGSMAKSSYLAMGVASKVEVVDIPGWGNGN